MLSDESSRPRGDSRLLRSTKSRRRQVRGHVHRDRRHDLRLDLYRDLHAELQRLFDIAQAGVG